MKIRLFTLPNIITLLNLLCGTVAITVVTSGFPRITLRVAFVLMLASALFDFLDGMVARLTKQYSRLGVQLDSLADMVSFGVLPTIIALKMHDLASGEGLWGLPILLIAAFSALRLAKFNIDDTQSGEFHGLPTPACALLIGAAGWYFAGHVSHGMSGVFLPTLDGGAEWISWVVVGASVALALLLISPLRMFSLKFKGFGLRENAVRYVFLAFALVLVALFGLPGVGLAVILYILSSAALAVARTLNKG